VVDRLDAVVLEERIAEIRGVVPDITALHRSVELKLQFRATL
jgi:hypothetical protein